MGLLILFALGQAVLLSKHIKLPEEGNK